jgi:uncharacterized protein
METVLITGGSGLVGRHLTKALVRKGFDVVHLTRNFGEPGTYYWNPKTGFINPDALRNAQHIVHLAGASLGEKRWSHARKQEILDSRILTARLLLDNIQAHDTPIKTFISASATGIYSNDEKIHTESDSDGNGFLATVCKHWESIADEFETKGIRTVKVRTGLVLTNDGGILPRLNRAIRFGLGAPFGSGNQGMPWIHMEDLCEIYCQAIENNSWKGAINAVAPETLTNKTFTKALTLQLKKPFWPINIPSFPIRWIMGEQSDLILKGTHVQPKRLLDMGFRFKFYEIGAALESLIKSE